MYEKEFELAKNIALEAGNMLKAKNNIHADSMDGKDIKLSSDKMSEKMIMDELSKFGYTILSEEYGLQDKNTDLVWIIDPLDGTMNYMKGMDDLVGISIALFKGDEPIFGVVNRFMCDELFAGVVGVGAYLNDVPIKPSSVDKLSQAVLATGFPVKRSYETEALSGFISQVQKFKKIRMLGAAAIMGTFVACGRIDAYMEEDIMLWDVAAASAIVIAAGGCADIKRNNDYKCFCKLFANDQLSREYNS